MLAQLFSRLLIAGTLAPTAGVALAQMPPRPPRPYAPVAIARPAPLADPAFEAFRTALAAAVKSRVYAELSALVQPQGFFWGRDFGRGYDPRKPAVDNLAAAVALEHADGAGWKLLADLAAAKTAEPLDSRPGVVCAPARPLYDTVAFSKLLDSTYTASIDWAYPLADETPVRLVAEPGAPVIGRIGLQFVRLLGFEGPDDDPDRSGTQWARVALPDAQTGYVAPASLRSLTAWRLCYVKDMVSGWRIAGTIAGDE